MYLLCNMYVYMLYMFMCMMLMCDMYVICMCMHGLCTIEVCVCDMYVWAHAYGSVCRGQRTASDVSPHLLPCLRWCLWFTTMSVRLTGPLSSGAFSASIPYLAVRAGGLQRCSIWLALMVSGNLNSGPCATQHLSTGFSIS